jgi:hypothetical protein
MTSSQSRPGRRLPGEAAPGDIICYSLIWSRSRIRAVTRAEGSPPYPGDRAARGQLGPLRLVAEQLVELGEEV